MCDHDTGPLDELESSEDVFPVIALVNTGWPGLVHWVAEA